MFKTVVHHTVKDQDNPDYVEKNAPFKAKDKGHGSYLGGGYYFWDNHFELACWWGEVHCGESYMVCKADFTIEKSELCDLVGAREDQIYLQQCIKELEAESKPMSAVIELLRELESNQSTKGIFPFKAIRAVDTYKGGTFTQTIFNFADRKPGETTLTPKMFICLFEKSPEILKNFKIIFPEHYVNY